MRALTLAVLISALSRPLPAQHGTHPFGTVRFPISCAPDTRAPFERGVALVHSFAFGQATAVFADVLRRDPQCAMASWGLALTAWTNPFAAGNKPAEQIARGRAAIQQGRAATTATARERAYLEAVAQLYEHADSLPQRARLGRYRDAMTSLALREPADTEAQIFRALALAIAADPADKTYAAQLEAGATLDRLAAVLPDHPGLAHYVIHAYDVPALAPRALDAANRYGRLAPDISHALHMPSHTYTRVGLWERSIATNLASGVAARREHSTAEELHADDYRMYAYLQLARDGDAERLLVTLPSVARRFDPTATGTGSTPAGGYFALAAMPARFALERGDWTRAASLDVRPGAPPYAEAITWFARALGAARSGDTTRADAAIVELSRLQAQLVRTGESYWAEQVEIQRTAGAAWRAFAGGQRDSGVTLMRAAAAREDATEKSSISPGPLAPARELLGDMLLAAGLPSEARQAYEATIAKEPNRFRAIAGAAEAARAAGDHAGARTHDGTLLALGKGANGPRRPALVEAARPTAR